MKTALERWRKRMNLTHRHYSSKFWVGSRPTSHHLGYFRSRKTALGTPATRKQESPDKVHKSGTMMAHSRPCVSHGVAGSSVAHADMLGVLGKVQDPDNGKDLLGWGSLSVVMERTKCGTGVGRLHRHLSHPTLPDSWGQVNDLRACLALHWVKL